MKGTVYTRTTLLNYINYLRCMNLWAPVWTTWEGLAGALLRKPQWSRQHEISVKRNIQVNRRDWRFSLWSVDFWSISKTSREKKTVFSTDKTGTNGHLCWKRTDTEERRKLAGSWWECKSVKPLWKTVWRGLRKGKSGPRLPSNHITVCTSTGWEIGVSKETHRIGAQHRGVALLMSCSLGKAGTQCFQNTKRVFMFIVVLVKTWNQLKCPAMDNWQKRFCAQ